MSGSGCSEISFARLTRSRARHLRESDYVESQNSNSMASSGASPSENLSLGLEQDVGSSEQDILFEVEEVSSDGQMQHNIELEDDIYGEAGPPVEAHVEVGEEELVQVVNLEEEVNLVEQNQNRGLEIYDDDDDNVIVIESEYEYSSGNEVDEIEILPSTPPGNNDNSDSSSARVVPSASRPISANVSFSSSQGSFTGTNSNGIVSSPSIVLSRLAQAMRNRRERLRQSYGISNSQVQVGTNQFELVEIDNESAINQMANEAAVHIEVVDNVVNAARDERDVEQLFGSNLEAVQVIPTIQSGESTQSSSVERDSQRDSNQDEEEDEEGPPQKMPRLETSALSENDDEGFICQICYEPFTNSGEHRVCCLKCGHVYGKECIERWILSSKRCPSCNCKAMKKDIRVIYVKNLKATDTAELERVKEELQKIMIEKNKVELSYQTSKQKELLYQNQIKSLKKEIDELNERIKGKAQDQLPGPSSRMYLEPEIPASSNQYTALKVPKVCLVKHFDIKEGQARVGAFNDWLNLYVVSHSIKSALFPGGSYGIKKINSLEWKAFQSFPIHQKPLRDMAFSLLQNELLLTVGLDKKAVLFNANSNVTVQTFNTDSSLWSCCWNAVNQNIFYVGAANGRVISYDIRSPHEPLGTLFIPTADRTSAARLKFVPPAYQSQSFNMSGLMIQKLNSVWFCEMPGGNENDARYHQLPIEGPFSNIDFEPSSRQILVSCRPKQGGAGQPRVASNHLICDLGKTYSEEEGRDLFSCDIVQTITSGFQESTMLCRSSLFSPHQGKVYLAANGERKQTVRIWDVSNSEQNTLVRINDNVAVDYVPGRVNERNFLGIITDKSTDVYEIK